MFQKHSKIKMRALQKKICKKCSKEFYTRSNAAKFCSKECKPLYKPKKTYTKVCRYCGIEFQTVDSRIKSCSLGCAQKASFDVRKKYMNKLHKKICNYCGVESMMYNNQRFCSEECKGRAKYANRIDSCTTEGQYLKISGNWNKYLLRLVHQHKRFKDGLTVEHLLDTLERQNRRCAISGVELTCILKKGEICKTNASIDRINAGGLYSPNNIQLVCRAVNSWRSNLTVEEFIEWCEKVVRHSRKLVCEDCQQEIKQIESLMCPRCGEDL